MLTTTTVRPFITSVTSTIAYDWMHGQYYSKDNQCDPGLGYIRPYKEMCDASHCYFIQVDDQTVGVCLMAKDNSSYMTRIYITPTHRGLGLAKYTIDYLKVTALACLKDNSDALELYKSLGFTVKYEHHYVVDMIRKHR